ncbi:hypothetical protein Asulf_00895 [Archaeoglobus sulfaticallidus PM70-1]|uniref:Uncharacterized protein n=1 Tax=Archaeoglobus sulfaticallidus PM70-1 TaxID=387631 RepID=N0BF54_9EURY|nr:hypothetical protein [Archaeoglobus sulfaticallidus]AGK60902.1 hypothetical protein Asulf_00895 [Archaeoglobus sulfaticallidus PM70-1]
MSNLSLDIQNLMLLSPLIAIIMNFIFKLINEIKEFFEKRSKRYLFLRILKEYDAIKRCIDSVSQKTSDYLRPKNIRRMYNTIIIISAIIFIVLPYLKYQNLDSSTLILLLSFISLGPIFIGLIFLVAVLSILLTAISKEKSIYIYWTLLAMEGAIIGYLIASYLSYAYLYISFKKIGIDETQLTKLFLLIFAAIFLVLFTSKIISFPFISSIRKNTEIEVIEAFRNSIPFIIAGTSNHTIRGRLWDFFDKEVIKIENIGIVSIPWNEISWIEVIENEEQNNKGPVQVKG